MDWFRHYHGLSRSPTLAVIARNLGLPRGVVVHAWCYLLEEASKADERGSIAEVDIEDMAWVLDVDEEAVDRILDALRRKGLLDGERIAKWDRYQRRSDDVAERVRRHRSRGRADDGGATTDETKIADPQGVGPDVTLQPRSRNVTVTPREEKSEEQRRYIHPPLPLSSRGGISPLAKAGA